MVWSVPPPIMQITNLSLCSYFTDDVLVKILTFYDNNSEDDSLPSSDEVLICNGNTSEEQV